VSNENLLHILNYCFLALLFLFLARVVRVVMLEMKAKPVPVVAAEEPVKVKAPKERRRQAALRIVEPLGRQGEVFSLDREITVGRGGGCQVVLADDTFVSQVHARLFERDGRAWVEDLGSRNGTFVNGKRIDAATRLRRGDRVQFGQTVTEVAG
jgi:FHA domain-containing protein